MRYRLHIRTVVKMDLLLALGFLAYSVYDAWRGPSGSLAYYLATWLMVGGLFLLTALSAIYWNGWADSIIVVAYLAAFAIQLRILMGIDRRVNQR